LTITCADGPLVFVDGSPTRLQVSASRADALSGQPVAARSCDTQPLDLSAGEHEVSLRASSTTLPVALTLTGARSLSSLGGVAQPGTEQVRRWDATSRTVQVDTQAASLLVVRENFNSGWQASLDGQRLDSVEVDGWQQAYVLPSGAHGLLRLEFTPQRAFVIGLLGGLAAALMVCLLAWWPPRRGHRDLPTVSTSSRYADARVSARVALTASALVLAALSGLAGPVTLLVLAMTSVVLWSWPRGIPSWFPALALMVGAVLVATVPSVRLFTEANSNLTQLLCVAALAAVFVGDGSERPNRAP
jgi:arabinofuranan 3-O-arabinosyltransferase